MPDPNATRSKSPFWRPLLATTLRVSVTLVTLGAAGAIGVTAHGVLSARAAEGTAPAAAPLTTVAPIPVQLRDSVSIQRIFTGQFEAAQDTALAFEQAGTVAQITAREGDRVAKGAVLARLDTRLLMAERTRLQAARRALNAEAELARRTNARQQALLATGHVSSQRVDETSLQLARLEASQAEIDAAIAALEVRLSKTELRAPFAGRIGARTLDTGAVVSPGLPVLTLLEDGPARFRVGLAPSLAASLTTGQEVTITAAGQAYPAHLAEVTPELDSTTRSQIAFFELHAAAAPPSRSTGEVTLIQEQPAKGAWVPLSALRQGPRGTWMLLTVAPGDPAVIGTEAVELLHLDADSAFVRGSLQEGQLILPAGTHRVVPGEAVRLAEGS